MQAFIKKADVLIEALPYIQKFRDAIIVVKFGGSTMDDDKNARGILEDVSFMECIGMRPVIVHGGGKAITRSMKQHGIAANFVNGLRVTCEKTIDVVAKVFKKEVSPGLVRMLEESGANAKVIQGESIFKVARKTGLDEKTGEELDWGFVGEPTEVDAKPILNMLKKGIIPVINPLGTGPDGKIHNINADTAAAAVAKALKARKIAFISDVPGLLRDPEDPLSIMVTLHAADVKELIDQGVIGGGMLPKVESAIESLKAGVKKVHFIDGRMPHSLLLEIFTDKGVGTEIIADEQTA